MMSLFSTSRRKNLAPMMYAVTKDVKGIRVITLLVDVVQFNNYEEVFNKVRSYINEINCLIVLDLSKVKFMDSLSLGMLVPLLLYAKRLDGDMVISAPDERIRDLFNILQLNKVIRIENNVEEAVNNLCDAGFYGEFENL